MSVRSVFGSDELPVGACRRVVVKSTEDDEYALVDAISGNTSSVLPTGCNFVLIHQPNENGGTRNYDASSSTWILCQILDRNVFQPLETIETSIATELSAFELFEYSSSVTLVGYPPIDEWKIKSDIFGNIHSASIISSSTGYTTQLIRVSFEKLPKEIVGNKETYFIPLGICIHLVNISSIFMTYESVGSAPLTSSAVEASTTPTTLQHVPLLQSCLKRQLFGCHLLVSDGSNNNKKDMKTTCVRFVFDEHRWTFFVDSMKVAGTVTSNCNQVMIAMIVPSSKITFMHPIPKPLKDSKLAMHGLESHKANTTSDMVPVQSPAVKILLDTIRSIHHMHAENSNISYGFIGDIPRAFLLTGPPGVGKTHAIRMAVQHASAIGIRCNIMALQGSEILSAGRSDKSVLLLERHFTQALRQTREENAITIMFLDECDALLSSPGTSNLVFESTLGRLLDELNSFASFDRTWVRLILVAATNRIDTIPTTLRRPGRFDREIILEPPDSNTRMKILQSLVTTHSRNNTLSVNELQEVADLCVGFVPADLAALVRRVEISLVLQEKDPICESAGQITPFDLWVQAVGDVGASTLRDASLSAPPATTWDDIAGDPGGAKTALRQAIEWPRTKRNAFQHLGLTAPRGILLHGPPGCSKTTLARAAAGASAVAFLSLSPVDVFATSYVGDAEGVIRRAFTLARSAAPCVLFFDEIDAILGSDSNVGHHGMGRGSSGNEVEARVLSTFLNEMDGIDGTWANDVIVLGATNRPWTLDAALLRPGRFDKIIYVPPPDFDSRRDILSTYCKHWTAQQSNDSKPLTASINVDYLASDTISGNMTGAEIVGACREAAMMCFRTVINETYDGPVNTSQEQFVMKEEYIVSALRNVRPLLSNPSIMKEFQSFQKHRNDYTKVK